MYTGSSENDLPSPTHGRIPYPKNTPPKKEARKVPKNFRLFADEMRRLKLGAEKMGVLRCNLSSVCPARKVRERRDLMNLTDNVPEQTPDDLAGCNQTTAVGPWSAVNGHTT